MRASKKRRSASVADLNRTSVDVKFLADNRCNLLIICGFICPHCTPSGSLVRCRTVTDELFYAQTADGHALAIHYYPGVPHRFRHPVVMLHGLAANRLNLDIDDRHSVARAAQERGFDVYLVELRGAGLSRRPAEEARANRPWGFGDHLSGDLPAILAAIADRTEGRPFHAFGHSMGGMVWMAFATTRPRELRSLTTVGTPLVGKLKLQTRERRLLGLARRVAPTQALKMVPVKKVLFAAGSVISLSAKLADGILLNARNTDDDVMARMAKEGVNDVPLQLILELEAKMRGTAGAADPFAYESKLEEVMAPVLLLSGSIDRIAPKEAVLALSRELRSKDVRYREMGLASGERTDYGHGDLLVGRTAPDEIFPVLLDFIEEMD